MDEGQGEIGESGHRSKTVVSKARSRIGINLTKVSPNIETFFVRISAHLFCLFSSFDDR